jgi:glucarate dehydratase
VPSSVFSDVRIAPIALKDLPLRNASGVHQPFALRSIIEIESCDGAVGLGETCGEADVLSRPQTVAPRLVGLRLHDLNGVARLVGAGEPAPLPRCSAPSTRRRPTCARREGVSLATWLGGAVRDRVAYSAHLFYKFGAHVDAPYEADA